MSTPLAGKRIGLLTASASRLGGGVFEAVVHQADMIRRLGGEPVVFALRDRFSDADAARFGPCRVVHCAVAGPRFFGFAPGLVGQMEASDLDCLHLHGIWMYPSWAGLRWARRTGRRYVVSIHGMLNPWITARGRWKKAIGRTAYERANWRAASVIHALTPVEAGDVAAECGRGDIVVIPNAAPPAAPPRSAMPPPRALYLGRAHPIKNLDNLVQGWRLANLGDTARLTLAGWGDPDDVAALERSVAAAGANVEFLGPVYGDAKDRLLAEARFVVLPSLTEGLPMAVLEGWAAGVPAIKTGGCNIPEGFAAGAALECGTDAPGIAETFKAAFALAEPEWLQMSLRARTLATSRFSPEVVAAQWADVYRGQTTEGERR